MCYCGFSKPIPNLSKSSQALAKPNKMDQRKRLGFAWILLSELGLFNGLQRPPRPKKILFLLLSMPLAFAALGALPSRPSQDTTTSDFRKGKSVQLSDERRSKWSNH
jgi:hypothetical protein